MNIKFSEVYLVMHRKSGNFLRGVDHLDIFNRYRGFTTEHPRFCERILVEKTSHINNTLKRGGEIKGDGRPLSRGGVLRRISEGCAKSLHGEESERKVRED